MSFKPEGTFALNTGEEEKVGYNISLIYAGSEMRLYVCFRDRLKGVDISEALEFTGSTKAVISINDKQTEFTIDKTDATLPGGYTRTSDPLNMTEDSRVQFDAKIGFNVRLGNRTFEVAIVGADDGRAYTNAGKTEAIVAGLFSGDSPRKIYIEFNANDKTLQFYSNLNRNVLKGVEEFSNLHIPVWGLRLNRS